MCTLVCRHKHTLTQKQSPHRQATSNTALCISLVTEMTPNNEQSIIASSVSKSFISTQTAVSTWLKMSTACSTEDCNDKKNVSFSSCEYACNYMVNGCMHYSASKNDLQHSANKLLSFAFLSFVQHPTVIMRLVTFTTGQQLLMQTITISLATCSLGQQQGFLSYPKIAMDVKISPEEQTLPKFPQLY